MDKNVVGRIERLRKDSGYSQALFARKCNVTPSNLNKMLHGTMNISEKTLLKIINTFNVNYEWLRNGVGEIYRKDTEKANMQWTDFLARFGDQMQTNTIHGNNNTGTQSINVNNKELTLLKQKVAMLEDLIKDKDRQIFEKDKYITRLMDMLDDVRKTPQKYPDEN